MRSRDFDSERMVTEGQSLDCVGGRSRLSRDEICIDRRLNFIIQDDPGEARPLIAIGNPGDAGTGEIEGYRRPRVHSKGSRSTAEDTVNTRVPDSGVGHGRVVVFNATDRGGRNAAGHSRAVLNIESIDPDPRSFPVGASLVGDFNGELVWANGQSID